MTEEICGAETQAGGKCQRQAGWGVNQEKENPENRCKFHLTSRNQDLKKKFLKLLEKDALTIEQAASKIDKDPSTIWHWRQKDNEFDESVREAKKQH